jgi:hypothetical protein
LAISLFRSPTHHQAVIRSKTFQRLHRSLIWQNFTRFMLARHISTDLWKIRLHRHSNVPSVSSCTRHMRLHKALIASIAMPNDRSDVSESRFEKISAVQASMCSRASRRICSSLMRLHGVPRATSALDPHLQPNPKLDSKLGQRVRISNLFKPNRPIGSSYPNRYNFVNSVH